MTESEAPPTAGPAQTCEVYLDAASSEPLHPTARGVLEAALDQGWADPRRLHREGRRARALLDNAREATAEALGVRRDEVGFTASGTDAVHRGLLGLLRGRPAAGRRVLCSAVEHSAVLNASTWSGEQVLARVDERGELSPDTVAGHLDQAGTDTGPVAVVAVQSANHEVATLQPLAEIAQVAARRAVPVFMDACASMGRLPLPPGWAVAAGSAHKWGGPAGVGVLLVRTGTRWATPFPADERADRFGSGFENVPAALAAAAALQAVVAERAETGPRQRALIDLVRARVAEIEDVQVVGHPDRRLPHLVTFSCLYVEGEALVTGLAREGYAVASGSACTASTLAPSHVLAAMGALTHGNVRLSVTRETTTADVEGFLAVLPGVVARIRAEVGL